MSLLYVIKCNEFIKIGISRRPKERLKALQTSSPYKLKIIKTYKVKQARIFELVIHTLLKPHHVRLEWFNCSPYMADKWINRLNEFHTDDIKSLKKIMHKRDLIIEKCKSFEIR